MTVMDMYLFSQRVVDLRLSLIYKLDCEMT